MNVLIWIDQLFKGGTSAHLQEGDVLTALQLFYGLMLPSGNDSAMVLAESFGLIIHKLDHSIQLDQYLDQIIDIEQFFDSRDYSNVFISEMNR